jgi:hypothetical protein
MYRSLAAVALMGISWVAVPTLAFGADNGEREPEVPSQLRVPAGHKLLFTVKAKGVQIYKIAMGKDGKPEWVFEAPLAELLSSRGTKVGCHYEGPSWEASDGSAVRKSDEKDAVKTADAPNRSKDIPWLLIKVTAAKDKKGVFSQATYVQRLHTRGGKAPAEAPVRTGTRVGVEYTASYCFYGRAE